MNETVMISAAHQLKVFPLKVLKIVGFDFNKNVRYKGFQMSPKFVFEVSGSNSSPS